MRMAHHWMKEVSKRMAGSILQRADEVTYEKQKGAFKAPFYTGGSCRMTHFARPSGRRRKRLRCLAINGSTRTCCRFESFLRSDKQKGAFRAPFYTGGSCRMTRFARPSGRRRKRLRCLAINGSARTCCRFESFWHTDKQKGAFRAPFYTGGSCRIRTCDQLIKSQLLYQLS